MSKDDTFQGKFFKDFFLAVPRTTLSGWTIGLPVFLFYFQYLQSMRGWYPFTTLTFFFLNYNSIWIWCKQLYVFLDDLQSWLWPSEEKFDHLGRLLKICPHVYGLFISFDFDYCSGVYYKGAMRYYIYTKQFEWDLLKGG